jgi:hypothetical protein
MRTVCHQRLRQAVYHWGRVSVQVDSLSRRHYTAIRQGGTPTRGLSAESLTACSAC